MATETVSMTISIAPVIRDAAHAARIEAAVAALESAHRAVGDAAGAWVDAGCEALRSRRDVLSVEAADLRDAVLAWRAAGETFLAAMAGRP
jgi:hypothetical protein